MASVSLNVPSVAAVATYVTVLARSGMVRRMGWAPPMPSPVGWAACGLLLACAVLVLACTGATGAATACNREEEERTAVVAL